MTFIKIEPNPCIFCNFSVFALKRKSIGTLGYVWVHMPSIETNSQPTAVHQTKWVFNLKINQSVK